MPGRRVVAAGWGYADLMPYFIRSETSPFAPSAYHGDSGPIRLMTPPDAHPITRCYMEAAEELGMAPIAEHNGPEMVGPTLNSLTIVDGKRQSVADAYLTPALARPNLAVREGCLVDRLTVAKGRCRGVEILEGGERHLVEAESGVILCAGVIGSPAILQRSGVGPADLLGSFGIATEVDLPGVGENLHDHLLAGGNVYLAKREVPFTKTQHSESLLYMTRSGDPSDAPELVTACVVVPIVTDSFEPPDFGQAYTLMFGFTRPRSRGRLRIQSTDPSVPPLIDPSYLAEAYDREVYLEAMERAREIGWTKALGAWRKEEWLPGPNLRSRTERLAFLEKAAFTHHHPVGSCRMGGDDRAVVDPSLAVRGVAGLHVIDGSVFPSITSGPNNAAIVAMAERASDLLRGRDPLPPFDPRLAE